MSMDRRKFLNLSGLGISSFTITGFIPKTVQDITGGSNAINNIECSGESCCSGHLGCRLGC